MGCISYQFIFRLCVSLQSSDASDNEASVATIPYEPSYMHQRLFPLLTALFCFSQVQVDILLPLLPRLTEEAVNDFMASNLNAWRLGAGMPPVPFLSPARSPRPAVSPSPVPLARWPLHRWPLHRWPLCHGCFRPVPVLRPNELREARA